jgi:hypothetical protein
MPIQRADDLAITLASQFQGHVLTQTRGTRAASNRATSGSEIALLRHWQNEVTEQMADRCVRSHAAQPNGFGHRLLNVEPPASC